mgnify:CR=1 FL=1
MHTNENCPLGISDGKNSSRYLGRISKYQKRKQTYFSSCRLKWTESFAMPNIETRTVTSIIFKGVICRLGVPAVIHSDQGRQFESKLFTEMCSLLGIRKTRITPYRPQSNGMVERFNSTLTTMMGSFVNDNNSDWDEQLHVQYVMMAYRYHWNFPILINVWKSYVLHLT